MDTPYKGDAVVILGWGGCIVLRKSYLICKI